MSNTVTAYFKGRVGVAEALYQNDYGIVMAFDGIDLPAHFDCYFTVPGSDTAIPGVGADNRVAIPNAVLANSGNVVIHIPLHTGDSDSEVEYIVYFKVIGRARPEDDGTPVQMTAIERALALLQEPIGNIEEIVNEALSFTGTSFNDINNKLDNLIANSTPSQVTQLWSGTLTKEGDVATLSQSIADFDFVDVYVEYYDSDYLRKPVANGSAYFAIQSQNLDDNGANNYLQLWEKGLQLSGTTATVVKNVSFRWDDFSAPPVVTPNAQTGTNIIRIDGIKLVSDTIPELNDVRYGADGVTYNNAGNAVRTQLTDLKSDLCGITGATQITFTEDKYISTAGSIGDTLTLEMNDNNAWRCAIINCKRDDSFLINVIGGNTPRAYCFVDENNKIIAVSDGTYTASNLVLVAPVGASKLVLNDYSVIAKPSYKDIDSSIKNVTEDINNRMESQYPLLQVPIKKGNLVEGILFPAERTVRTTVVKQIEYSSIHLGGSISNGTTSNISRGGINFDSEKEYTIKLECEEISLPSPIVLAFSEVGGSDVKKQDNTNVAIDIAKSSITHFTPYSDYSNVSLGLWQGSGSSISIDHTITLYVLEGHYEEQDFAGTGPVEKRVGVLEQNLSEMAGIKDSVRAANQFPIAQHQDSQTIGGVTITPIKYSGIHIVGNIASGTTGGITKRGITLKQDHTYTLCVVANTDTSLSPIVLSMGTILDDVKDTSGRNVVAGISESNVVVFSPYEDYTNARFNLWQGTENAIPIDHDMYVFLAEGIYDLGDFGALSDDIGIQLNDFRRTHIVGDLYVGLPILELTGDVTGMSKDDEVSLKWTYGNDNGDCAMKWQGSSSLNYSKKNYTIKLDNKIDVGWGEQKKYCLKANYIDSTSALNVCSAKLWSQIVANRNTNPAIDVAANNGAMDGFPIIITLNGKFHGLYTLNTPKDKWTFGMGDGEAEYLVTAENHSLSTQFKSTTNLDGTDMELEYAPDDVTLDIVKSSVNTMLNAVINATGAGWESAVGNYLDVGTAIDYMIFSAIMSNIDGIDKNFILSTYDGTKWFLNAYDLDSVLGNDWDGGSYYSPAESRISFANMSDTSRLFHLIYTYSKPALIARYDGLRRGILSETNLLNTFYNFCVAIPEPIASEDNKKWPLKPGTSTKTLSRIMEWYRLHIKVVDDEIDALRN